MKGVKEINLTYSKILSCLARFALLITASNVNTACWYIMGQDELPDNASKLRKFK